jgi:hypothetical protein
VERRLRPKKKDRLKGVLPKEVERIVERTGQNAEEVRQRLEQDFYDWMQKKRPQQAPGNARQSFWKTWDAFVGPLAALGTKSLAERLFAADPKRNQDAGERPGGVTVADSATAKIGRRVSERVGDD